MTEAVTPPPAFSVQAVRREYNAAGEVVAVIVSATTHSTGARPLELHSAGVAWAALDDVAKAS
jgi:hypothetical protein